MSGPTTRGNLSQWALEHRSLLLYFVLVVVICGVYGYQQLSRSEAPPFTFKVMVVKTLWPGASTQEVRKQVTRRISRELHGLPNADFIKAYSRPGESMIFFVIKDSLPPSQVPETWYQVRKHVNDMVPTLPEGIVGPFFDDEFGDVYTNIYALEGDGFSPAELKHYADLIRSDLMQANDVAKVDFFGVRPQRIFIDISNERLAGLGISPDAIVAALKKQNAIIPAGSINTPVNHIAIRTSGQLKTVQDIRQVRLNIEGQTIRLGDIAHVYRGYEQPPGYTIRYNSKPVLGIGVTMQPNGNVVELGKHLTVRLDKLQQQLPAGLTLHTVTDMPTMVDHSVDDFIEAVGEAIIIVLLVSLITLGLRTGTVIVIAIPLVLAATAFCMWIFGIGLNKVSLGTLILALGLLVDDAIIAIEMMLVKLEQGYSRFVAAGHAYNSTAFPMLTGTLVTVAGFIPIALAKSSTGEYTRALFEVSSIALLSSWLVSVLVVPWLGYKLIPEAGKQKANPLLIWLKRRFQGPARRSATGKTNKQGETDIYSTPFYRWLRSLVSHCVDHRRWVLGLTLVVFAGAMLLFTVVPQQFFPVTPRPELLVNLQLPQSASRKATLAEVEKMEALLEKQPQVVKYTTFVGGGAPRFFLPLDEKLPQRNFAQILVLTKGEKARIALHDKLVSVFDGTRFEQVRGRVKPLTGGPPVSYPVAFQITGPDIDSLRHWANTLLELVRQSPDTIHAHLNWDNPAKVVQLEINQYKASQLGLTSKDIAGFLQMSLSGYQVTGLHNGNDPVKVVLRSAGADRDKLDRLEDLSIPTGRGTSIPLSQVASFHYVREPGIIWSRNGQPVIAVQADVKQGAQGIDVAHALLPKVNKLRDRLPAGYHIKLGGTADANAKAQTSINAGIPLMLFVIFTLLMIQVQSFRRTLIVVLTAPLGLIGVTVALLVFFKPFGFVAMIGTIAMFGIIMRNSVILVDQIDQDMADGASMRTAIIEATVRRFRPIMLTASAAVLALIPLVPSNFFGPMAVALMGGISVATVLTSFVLPAMFAVFMRMAKHDALFSSTADQ